MTLVEQFPEVNVVSDLIESMIDGLRPKPYESIVDWAPIHRFLPKDAAAEGGGPIDLTRTPYIIEPLECLSPDSTVERVVMMFGAQLAKSEALNTFIAYVMAKGLGSAMLVQPNLTRAKEYSKTRIDPMIRDTPQLAALFPEKGSRDDPNQILLKKFDGGALLMRGAETASGLASSPIRFLAMDELDRYPQDVENEGNPVDLAIMRTAPFARRKLLLCSTPVAEGTSLIAQHLEQTDQRRYVVPCPSCDTFQRLEYSRISCDRDKHDNLIADRATYTCVECGEMIPETEKTGMVEKGHWEATAVPINPDYRGYQLSALYSPWRSWSQIIETHRAAGRNRDKLKVWTNTDMAEVFKDEGEAPDWMKLYRRRELYPEGKLPAGVHVLTAAADAQRDRIECEVVGWGPNLESWSIDYIVIAGDTSTAEPWKELQKLLTKRWHHENGGDIGLARLGVDAGDGAHSAAQIYRWARSLVPRVLPIRGVSKADILVGRPRAEQIRKGRKSRRSFGLHWPVGVSMAKAEFYGWLRSEEPAAGEALPVGWCHFPQDRDEDWFQQITAERRSITRDKKGNPSATWKVIAGRRNEGLDCRVYARAVAFVHGIDGWSPQKWETVYQDTYPDGRGTRTKPKPAAKKPRRKFMKKRGKSWLSDGR